MIAHNSPISGVDAQSDRLVATAGYDNQVILWDAAKKTSVNRVYHDHLANQCRFSACGRYLVSAGSDYTARLWCVPSLRLQAVFGDHDDDVELAVINPTSDRVGTAARDHCARIFDFAGRLLFRLEGHSADVLSIEWTHGGSQLLTSSDDGTVRRWCADTGRVLEIIDFGGVQTDTLAVADDKIVYAGNDDGQVIMVKEGRRKIFEAHCAGIKRLIYHSPTRRLLTASYDRTVKLWAVLLNGDLTLMHSASVPAIVWLRSCAFVGDSHAVFGSFGSSYAEFCLETAKWDLANINPTPGINAVRVFGATTYAVGDAGIVFRDRKPVVELGSLCNFIGGWQDLIVTGGQLGILFNASSGAVLHQHASPLNCSATFSRAGDDLLVVGTYTGEGLVFRRSKRGLNFVAALDLHDNAVKGIACNGTHIFSVCATGAAAFHSIESLSCSKRIPDAHEKISNGAAVLSDGRFASVSRDRKLRIWSEHQKLEIQTPHHHSIKCVSSAELFPVIATAAYDGKVALYDWSMQSWIYMARPTAAGISSLAAIPGTSSFLASSYDGHIYNVPEP